MLSRFHFCATLRSGAIFLLIAVLVASTASAEETGTKIDFPHSIVPILKAHCVECHGGHRHEGDFSLNTRESVLKAEAVVPGKSAESRLIDTVVSRQIIERQAEPSDVWNIVSLLLSPESSMISGETIHVGGA